MEMSPECRWYVLKQGEKDTVSKAGSQAISDAFSFNVRRNPVAGLLGTGWGEGGEVRELSFHLPCLPHGSCALPVSELVTGFWTSRVIASGRSISSTSKSSAQANLQNSSRTPLPLLPTHHTPRRPSDRILKMMKAAALRKKVPNTDQNRYLNEYKHKLSLNKWKRNLSLNEWQRKVRNLQMNVKGSIYPTGQVSSKKKKKKRFPAAKATRPNTVKPMEP